MRAAEHAPRDRFYLLERIRGLAKIIERGFRVFTNCIPVVQPQLERDIIIITENASRGGATGDRRVSDHGDD